MVANLRIRKILQGFYTLRNLWNLKIFIEGQSRQNASFRIIVQWCSYSRNKLYLCSQWGLKWKDHHTISTHEYYEDIYERIQLKDPLFPMNWKGICWNHSRPHEKIAYLGVVHKAFFRQDTIQIWKDQESIFPCFFKPQR